MIRDYRDLFLLIMNGIRKYEKKYKEEIENGFNDLYKKLKREYISNEERLKRLNEYADNKLDHFGNSRKKVKK